jgi:hypothetical protein
VLNTRAAFLTLGGVALSFLINTNIWAAKVSTTKEAVARAQELFLHKNRQAALKILLQARQTNAPSKGPERDELNEAFKDAATRFLTDKGQRSFELGISQLPAHSSSALTHLREAEATEDGNAQVQEAIVRSQIAAEDCKGAAKTLQELKDFAIALPQIPELELQVGWCTEDLSGVELLIKRKAPETKLTVSLSKVANAWVKWRQSEPEKALSLLREVVATDSRNPAVLYWLWKIEAAQDQDAQAAAAAFAKRCRNHEAEFRRRSSSMIEMCLHITEVEAYLKSKGAENPDESS